MPYLTIVRDTDGDGTADEKKDLFKDLGQTANKGLNDHIVSGHPVRHGRLALHLLRRQGRAQAPPGPKTASRSSSRAAASSAAGPTARGWRSTPSAPGTTSKPTSSALDDLFTYDNTDDGDGWWTRVTHHVNGGYYGYPYDYHDRPDAFLPPMAEYGGGSPCGAVVYKEDAWPEKYRGVGFWAEWGKGKVHAFRFSPKARPTRSPRRSTSPSHKRHRHLPPDRPRPLPRRQHPLRRRLEHGRLGQGGKSRPRLRVTTPARSRRHPARRHDAPIPDQIKHLDHPAFNERMRAQVRDRLERPRRPSARRRLPLNPKIPRSPAPPDLDPRRHRRRHPRGDRTPRQLIRRTPT